MGSRNFMELLKQRWAEHNTLLCVGLDSEFSKIPAIVRVPDDTDTIFIFNRDIIEATKDLVCAYKPNIAFYNGLAGRKALAQTCKYIRDHAPGVPIILDAKRGDIGNSNIGYVKEAFDEYGADAVTVSPYFGKEALGPFLELKDKGVIVLCRTSNPGGDEFQDLWLENGIPLYRQVAAAVVNSWNENGNCALVVGATKPKELREVRSVVGDLPLLVPGIGKQGGDLEKTVCAGLDSRRQGMMINSSSGVIFASSGNDYPEAARKEAMRLRDEINQYRKA